MNDFHHFDDSKLDISQSTMQLSLFPFHLPDELHASQAARYHEASGNTSTFYSYQQLYGASPFRLTYWIPPHLEQFAAKLPGLLTDNVEFLLRQSTLFPLFETYSNASLNIKDNVVPIAKQIVNMPKRIVGESGETHLCTDCLRSDYEEFGQPYIHRAHQIPGVQVCWRHECRLLSSCPCCGCPFERKNELVLAPWEACEGCGLSLLSATFYVPKYDASIKEVSYASFAREMLLSKTKPLDAEVLASIYRSRLSEMGYNRGTNIDRQAIMADMEEYFGKEILAQIDTAYRNQKNQHWFRICIPSAVFDVPLPRHLALSQFLFGSASKFWEYAAQIAEREKKPVVVTNSLSSKHSTAKRSEVFKQSESDTMVTKLEKGSESVCAQIEKILCDNIGWTEANLWMTYPGLMKRLLRDRADGVNWLKTLLETIKTTAKEKHLLQESKYHSEDMQWTQAFTNTAINLYTSTDKPKKISRNLLMREAGWKKLNIPDPRKFPIARQQLELLKESTWHFYARRILWSKLRLNEIGSSSRDALGPSGIEHHQGSLVLNYFSSVPSNRILRPGAIMQILTEHKIPKEWEGPVSGISFLRPGRNSSCGGQLYE